MAVIKREITGIPATGIMCLGSCDEVTGNNLDPTEEAKTTATYSGSQFWNNCVAFGIVAEYVKDHNWLANQWKTLWKVSSFTVTYESQFLA